MHLPDLDTYTAAQHMVDRHGEHAILAAARRADEMTAAKDREGYAVWKLIIRAIAELQRTEPRAGEWLN